MNDFKDIKIAVAGTGYVGLSIATLLSQHHHVTAVDVIPEKVEKLNNLKSATYRVSWEFTCKTTKILLLYIFLGHNRNVVNTKFPYPIKRLEVIRRFNQKSMAFNQSLS